MNTTGCRAITNQRLPVKKTTVSIEVALLVSSLYLFDRFITGLFRQGSNDPPAFHSLPVAGHPLRYIPPRLRWEGSSRHYPPSYLGMASRGDSNQQRPVVIGVDRRQVTYGYTFRLDRY